MRITPHARMGIKRHHNTWRAKAALRGLGRQHRCLDGMRRAIGGGKPLNTPQRQAMRLTQRHQAGIDGRAGAIRRFNHHSTGAAITLRTALLGAGQPRRAQPIEQGHGRGRVGG